MRKQYAAIDSNTCLLLSFKIRVGNTQTPCRTLAPRRRTPVRYTDSIGLSCVWSRSLLWKLIRPEASRYAPSAASDKLVRCDNFYFLCSESRCRTTSAAL